MTSQEIKYMDLTLPGAAANLALDEALLDACETGAGPQVLRFWESPEYFVVVGYGNQIGLEVDVEECRAHGVPILRRCSGGGTVLQGPGCLSYTLVLRITDKGPLENIARTNRYVMDRHKEALSHALGQPVHVQGITDLSVGPLKFSGNAQRRKRAALIFHGTFLLDFDISRVERLLPMPSKEPHYRGNRSHETFLANLKVPAAVIKEALQSAWDARNPLTEVPDTRALVKEKYGCADWNWRF